MSKPMTAAQWRAQLKKWRVPTVYLAGWETRGRPASTAGGPFDDVHGVMIHHTGSDDQRQSYIDWLFKVGRPAEGIPAPLANAMTMMDGRLIMGAIGKANHAGRGVKRILDKVIAETVSLTSEEKPGATGTVNGNPEFYGDEVAFDGGQPMTAAQYDTVVRWCAAICDFHGWSGASVIGHGEWTSAKWDPGQTDMAKLRRDVNALLKAGPGDAPAEPEPPAEPKPLDVLDPANYPDAQHPDRNTEGSQITWLGERLVAHGFDSHYRSGPGPNWSEADRANVADFQKAQGWTGDDADGYPGPTTLRLLAADPTVTPPKPPGVTVTSVSQNFAGNNAHGIATAVARIRRYVAARKSTPVDIINAQECTVASLVRPRLDSGLEPLGYARVNGGKGRYQYRGADVTVLAHGLITTPRSTWFKGDDKQAAWVVYSKGGAVGMDVSLHLESASGATADRLRVDQAKYIAGQSMKIAELHGCPLTNILLVGDTNSEGMVLAALVKAGWRNCAAGTEFENAHTFMGWDGKSRKRFDYGFVRQDAPDAKVVAISHDTSISDHAGLRIERELTA